MNNRAHVHALQTQRLVPEPREAQQVVDELLHALDAQVHGRQEALRLGRQVGRKIVEQQFGQAVNGAQRSPQIETEWLNAVNSSLAEASALFAAASSRLDASS